MFSLKSSSFEETIPVRFSLHGPNCSPALSWTAPPERTRSLVLLVTDPDAPSGTFTHWVIYNLPPTLSQLPEDQPKAQHLPNGGKQGRNDYGKIGYGGPAPPPGSAHHYHFRLYALDTRLSLVTGPDRISVEAHMAGHVLETAEMVGLFAT